MLYLIARQRPDGMFERGWSLSETNAAFRALFALRHYPDPRAAGMLASIQAATDNALAGLMGSQNIDGGWGQRPGETSDVLSTSYALLASTAVPGDSTVVMLERGVEYLLARQRPDGGFTSIPDSAGPRPIPHDVPILADAFALLALSHTIGPIQEPAL